MTDHTKRSEGRKGTAKTNTATTDHTKRSEGRKGTTHTDTATTDHTGQDGSRNDLARQVQP